MGHIVRRNFLSLFYFVYVYIGILFVIIIVVFDVKIVILFQRNNNKYNIPQVETRNTTLLYY